MVKGRRSKPDPQLYAGSGKVEEILRAAEELNAMYVVFNHALSPAQERNLEKVIVRRVMDRTELILEIFAQRAQTSEGKLQVELAQLQHLSTRLVRGWTPPGAPARRPGQDRRPGRERSSSSTGATSAPASRP